MAKRSSPQSPPGHPDPAELRHAFGENLKALCAGYTSISDLCRDLGINRTQFNRYLAGESFPRLDVLYRICAFFNVDVRILLGPFDRLHPNSSDLLNHPVLSGFFGAAAASVPPDLFPSGFYRFIRRSFIKDTHFALGLVYVLRRDGYTFLRGYEPQITLRRQGLSVTPQSREYRGLVLRQNDGIIAVVSHRNALSCSFNFLAPEQTYQANLWEGYTTRNMREKVTGRRAARMVYEHLGHDRAVIMQTARMAGRVRAKDIPAFHADLLHPDREFR